MATAYILYSCSLNKFYIGSCQDFSKRLNQHNSHVFENSFTKRASDWVEFFVIPNIEFQQARKIEQHIKSMKSSIYNHNLKKYPEISNRLIEKYKAGSCKLLSKNILIAKALE